LIDDSNGSGAIDAFYAKYGIVLVDEFIFQRREVLEARRKGRFPAIQERLEEKRLDCIDTKHWVKMERIKAEGEILNIRHDFEMK
jgi:hypothetical protein